MLYRQLNPHKHFAALLTAVLAGTAPLSAAERYVRAGERRGDGTSWSSAWSIEEARRRAEEGDTVCLAGGEHVVQGEIEVKSGQCWLGGFPNSGSPAVADRNAAAHKTVIRPATPGQRVISIPVTAAGVRLDGLTITGGGGVSCRGRRCAVVRCVITGNRLRCVAAKTGGGAGLYAAQCDLRVSDCVITGNEVVTQAGYQGGGGIYLDGGKPAIENCRITGNVVRVAEMEKPYFYVGGGGLFVHGSAATVSNCVIENNRVEGLNHTHGGGAVYSVTGPSLCHGCTIQGNTVTRGMGGAVFVVFGDATFRDCQIVGNSASRDGGAVFQRTKSRVALTNCVVAKNMSASCAIYISPAWGNTLTRITDCTFEHNWPSDIYRTDANNAGKSYKADVEVTRCRFTYGRAAMAAGKLNNGGRYIVEDTDQRRSHLIDTAPPVNVALPEPVFHLHFDDPHSPLTSASSVVRVESRLSAGREAPIALGEGIVGSDCLSPTTTTPLVYGNPKLLSALGHAKSLTVTGWFKTRLGDSDRQHQRILTLGKALNLYLHGTAKGRLMLLLPRPASGKPTTLCGSYFCHHFPALFHNCWSFFAATYDGTKRTDNVSFYLGTERHALKHDHTYSSGAGPLGPANGPLLVGTASADGGETFAGLLDSLRVYASRDDGSAALTRAQIEAIRQQDLGEEWISGVVQAKEQAEAVERAEHHRRAAAHWGQELSAALVELLDNQFPDRPPEPVLRPEPLSVPRGAHAPFQFVVTSTEDTTCRMEVLPLKMANGKTMDASTVTYEGLPVPVEANNNGGMATGIKRTPNPMWRPYFIREAPFEVSEVLVATDELRLRKGRYCVAVLDIEVPADAEPGVYRGEVQFQISHHTARVPFALRVHRTAAPTGMALKAVHWLHPEPENLTTSPPPEWWSERHWQLLERAGRTLRAFGDTAILTPVLGAHPTVGVTVRRDGTYAFDFTRFDRWVETFKRLGYEEFDGRHVVAWHSTPAFDERTGKAVPLLRGASFGRDAETTQFLEAFYKELHRHLTEKGWLDAYVQCQLDEPHDEPRYRTLASLLRKHLPGVRSKDAINGRPEIYSPLVDIHVFGIVTMVRARLVVERRRADGREIWMYHCCSPYPPYPNRHLDEALTGSRLYPWLAYLHGAQGYLFWAANCYRGADPYAASVGPLRAGGYTEVGHPPGDNWMFYKYEDGLRPGLRALAFREGLLDHTLLTMLAQRDRERADAIMRSIARSLLDFEREPPAYHKARTALLTALDQDPPR